MVLTHYYAQLGPSRIVFAVTQLAEAINSESMVEIESLDAALLGKIHNADTGAFEDAPPDPAYVPFSVSSRQGKLALLGAGFLDQAEEMIESIPDPIEKKKAQIEWGATDWERNNPFLQQMWGALGGTPDDLDDLFRLAITI